MAPDPDEREGVIKFSCRHRYERLPLEDETTITPLFKWRELLGSYGMVGGGDPSRYQGAGFGNLSVRSPPHLRDTSSLNQSPTPRSQFVITGSQTGHLDVMSVSQLAWVHSYSITQMSVESTGETLPSSESLTHAMIYQLRQEISWVFHVHSPELWRARDQLKLPSTPAHISYGTQEMAHAVERLFQEEGEPIHLILAMAGHEDGIISYGNTALEAGAAIIKLYQRVTTL